MTWVKICGITNLEDARTAVEAGAHALGFVFYEKSPRKVDPDVARQIVAELPEGVEKVGVFVDASQRSAIDVFNAVRLTAMQWHVDFEAMYLQGDRCAFDLGCFWREPKVFYSLPAAGIISDERRLKSWAESFAPRPGDEKLIETPGRMPRGVQGCTLFLDAGTAEQPGGTGKTFDWGKALPLVYAMRKNYVVIAGGLNPTNVGNAIRILHPWGVDVASGVEARPGKKDPEKLRAFVKAVREAENSA